MELQMLPWCNCAKDHQEGIERSYVRRQKKMKEAEVSDTVLHDDNDTREKNIDLRHLKYFSCTDAPNSASQFPTGRHRETRSRWQGTAIAKFL